MRVFLIGDLMIDDYHHCIAKGVSPEAPILHFDRQFTFRQLGGAGNVAANLSALQTFWAKEREFRFLGPVPGDMDEDLLGRVCFRDSFRDNQPVCVKNRIVSGPTGQQVIRYDDDSIYLKEKEADFKRHIRQAGPAKIGIVSDYNHGAITQGVLRELRKTCELVLADPKGNDHKKYRRNVDILTPNLVEVHDLVPGGYSHDDAAKQLLELTRAFAVVLKKGGEGCAAFVKDGSSEVYEPYRTVRSVVDVTGAGDTFIATLSMALAQGIAFFQAVKLANTMAGISVTKQGCFVPGAEEIKEALLCQQ